MPLGEDGMAHTCKFYFNVSSTLYVQYYLQYVRRTCTIGSTSLGIRSSQVHSPRSTPLTRHDKYYRQMSGKKDVVQVKYQIPGNTARQLPNHVSKDLAFRVLLASHNNLVL